MKIRKLFISFLTVMCVAILGSISVSALTYEDYTYTVTDGKVCITDFSTSVVGDIVVPEEIDGNPVTSIGDNAFQGCNKLTSVKLPSGVTSIGRGSFYNCTKIIKIELPSGMLSVGDNAFSGCIALSDIVLPDSLTTIGSSAFMSCQSIRTLKIPSGVDCIENSTFYSCRSLEKIEIPQTVTSIGSSAFKSCSNLVTIEIPSSVESIGSSAFYGCSSLRSISIPSGITEISGGTFSGCTNLTFVNLPDGIISIGNEAFRECAGINFIEIPKNVQTIGLSAFFLCSNLETILIHKNLLSIDMRAFHRCLELKNVYYTGTESQWQTLCNSVGSNNESLTSATNIVYNYTPIAVTGISIEENKMDIYARSAYKVPVKFQPENATNQNLIFSSSDESVVTISEGSIMGVNEGTAIITVTTVDGGYTASFEVSVSIIKSGVCGDNLTWTVDNENTLTITGTGDMYDWSYIDDVPWKSALGIVEKVVIKDGVTSIGSYAFYESEIADFDLAESIKEIGGWTFYSCKNLVKIKLPPNIKKIDEYTFYNCTGLQNIKMPETAESIGELAFGNCYNLKSIKIPYGVTNLYSDEFWECNGILNIYLPDTVTNIADYTFSACNRFENIILPAGLTQIDGFFINAGWVQNIVIPNTIQKIGTYEFENCSINGDVYFLGTESEWNAIDFTNGNSELENADVHFIGEDNKTAIVPMIVMDGYEEDSLAVWLKIYKLPEDSLIYVASYDDNQLIDVKLVDKNSLEAELSGSSVDEVRCFVWDEEMIPLCVNVNCTTENFSI